MSKVTVAAASTGVVGTGAAGMYGAHLLGAFSSGTSNEEDSLYIHPDKTQFIKHNGGYCFGPDGGVFKNWSDNGRIDKAQDTNTFSQEDIKLDGASNDPAKGCLVVNWNKAKTGEEWEGSNFRFVWTLAKGQKGLAVYLTGTTTSNTTVEFEGVAYAFGKQDDKWSVSKKLDMAKKILSSSEIKEKFPKKDGSLTIVPSFGSEYWDFLEIDNSSTKIKKEESVAYSRKEGYSKFDSEDNSGAITKKEVKQWSSNFDAWWNHFFGSDKWNMPDALKSIQGVWSQYNEASED